MSIDQLRQLVRRYVGGDLSYDAFRDQFVSDFLAGQQADAMVERLSNSIESVCADFSQGYIADALALKGQLVRIALPVVTTSPLIAGNFDFVVDHIRNLGNVLPDAWWTVNVNSISIVPVGPRNDGMKPVLKSAA